MPQSLASAATSAAHTVDREKLRDKAWRLQMHENLRLAMCARLQQQFKKPPRVADELATQVLLELKRRGLGFDVGDDALAQVVRELGGKRQDQLALASNATTAPTARENPKSGKASAKASGRRSSSSGAKDSRSARKSGRKNSVSIDAPSNNSNKGPFATEGKADPDAYLTESQLRQRSTGFSLPPRASPKRERDSGIWEQIVKFSSVEEQREAEWLRLKRDKEREELVSRLAAQLEHKQQRSQQERQLSAEFHRQAIERLQQQDESERSKERERLARAKALTEIQKQQREAKAQQLAREKELRRLQEDKAVALIRKQQEDDAAREHARREAEKRRVELVLHENEQQLQRKREEREREHARDMQLAEQYAQMEEAKDAARRAQLDALAQSIQKKMKVFGDTAKADMDSRAQEEEQRVLRYQREYAAQQAQKEKDKREAAEARALAQQQFLRTQMAEKRAREEELRRDLDKQAELWRQERAEAERRDKLAAQQRAARNRSQQEVLKEQMREREAQSLAADQSALEVQLNAGLLDKIQRQSGVVSDTQSRSRQVGDVGVGCGWRDLLNRLLSVCVCVLVARQLQQQEDAVLQQRRGGAKL